MTDVYGGRDDMTHVRVKHRDLMIGASHTPALRMTQAGSISIATSTTPGVIVQWAGTPPTDRFALLMSRLGDINVVAQGSHVRRGSTVHLIADGAFEATLTAGPRGSEMLCLSADARLRSRAGHGDDNSVHSVVASPVGWHRIAPLYAALRAMCASAHAQRGMESAFPSTSADIAEPIVAALARIVLDDIADDICSRVRAYVREHSANPHQSVGTIANRLGIPRRTLQSALAEAGTSVSAELRAARLANMRRAQQQNPGLSAIALYQVSGFPSLSSMYRAVHAEAGTACGAHVIGSGVPGREDSLHA